MMHDDELNWELIVHRLDSIAKYQEVTSSKLDIIEEKLTKLETIKHSVNDLKNWKDSISNTVSINELKDIKEWKRKFDEIISPSQLKKTLEDIDKFKIFKTQALMIWAVVQAAMVVLIFLEKFNII